MSRRYALATVTLAALSFLAACGGTGAQLQATPTPTPTPQPTVAVYCGAIQDITSYRYVLRLNLNLPELPPAQASPQDDVFGAFGAMLFGLLSDIQIEGAYVAPDRSQAILRLQDQEVEVRTIGGQSWVRLGDVWQEETTPAGEVLLSPQTVCDEIVPDLGKALQPLPWTAATLNGVATRQYHLEETDLPRLAGVLGAEEEDTLPEQFVVDIWLAEEGQWPVKLHLLASGSEGEGQMASLELFLEFRDINSPDIEIEPPEVVGGQA